MAEPSRHGRWHRRARHARHALGHSLRVRLVALFLLLALAMTATFLMGMQKALSIGWRDAARPLVTDYVDRLVADIGSPPSIERAHALTQRLPISVRIDGPQVRWQSQGGAGPPPGHAGGWDHTEPRFWERTTADGHRIAFGLSVSAWERQPRRVGWITLTVMLVLTALAYAWVRRLLRPLDDIREGAQRFGSGAFDRPIPIRRRDELGQLATDVNTMAASIHQMLEAKRSMLLAISHELRSPLTRARLNTELLPDEGDIAKRREALLRDLSEMRDLVTDLLEGERLGQGHAALQLELTDLGALAAEVAALAGAAGDETPVAVQVDAGLPLLALDRTRMRLLLRNLLSNARRHSVDAPKPPRINIVRDAQGGVRLSVRDHGGGVDEAALPHLAEPFYRPDADRSRGSGGVGLGLYLCKLVAQAHAGRFLVENAHPGLCVTVVLPAPS